MIKAKPAVVGGFILGGLALAVAVVLLFSGRQLFSTTVHAVVYFQESVANLEIGAPVTFRGVRVGTVTRIAVTLNMTDLTARIPVYLDLDPSKVFLKTNGAAQAETSFDRLLKAGLRAQLDMQSLVTGQLRVDLDLEPNTAAVKVGGNTDRPEIPSVPSKLKTLEGAISELPLKEITENARQALAAMQHVSEELAVGIGPLADSLKQTLDAAHVTLEDIDRLAVDGRQQLAANGDRLERVLASTDRTMHQAETLMVSLNSMTTPDSQIRGDLQAALRDLAASASSLRGFSREIERDPSAILSGRTNR